jgi:asparagine synthase (glutamine-hydrolysing)
VSGIAGVLRLDHHPVSEHALRRVATALAQYGPDRSEITIKDNVGLVHTLMRLTPEDRFDRQPRRSPSGTIITADVRLDNRAYVLARVGIPQGQAMQWADSQVLLAAWEIMGDKIWPMLRGPFAVAIWNPRSQTLTLARDHLGLRVLMWHRNEQLFAFSTFPKGLFALGDIPCRLNENKLADFLVLNHGDLTTTIYENIFRIPPAHFVQVQASGPVKQHRFWSPEQIAPVRHSSDQAYADGLRECLDVAVRRQMRSAHPIGCLLSGGLDSSSVCALAAGAMRDKNQRIAAFTGVPRRGFDGPVPDGTYADETPYVEAIAKAMGNIDVTYVTDNGDSELDDLQKFFIALDGPVSNPSDLSWMLSLLRTARAAGRRVLLGGLYGNYTISWNGWSQVAGHLKHGKFFTACRQARLFHRRTPYSACAVVRKLLLEPLLPEYFARWTNRRRHHSRLTPWQDFSPIRPDFASATDVDRRALTVGHDFHYRMRLDERLRGLASVDYIGDWYAAEKAVTGVELRDPTADIDVVCYCFGIPAEQYLVERTDRSLIRRAMWGLLPEAILTNRMSGLQAADWYEKLERKRSSLGCEVAQISRSPLASRIIDVERLKRAVQNWPSGNWYRLETYREYNLALRRGLAHGHFLRWIESANG